VQIDRNIWLCAEKRRISLPLQVLTSPIQQY
jgi:hypothetical protein